MRVRDPAVPCEDLLVLSYVDMWRQIGRIFSFIWLPCHRESIEITLCFTPLTHEITANAGVLLAQQLRWANSNPALANFVSVKLYWQNGNNKIRFEPSSPCSDWSTENHPWTRPVVPLSCHGRQTVSNSPQNLICSQRNWIRGQFPQGSICWPGQIGKHTPPSPRYVPLFLQQ